MVELVILLWHVLLGLIVGSFLNVVIYRLHTGRSLRGRSHCMSCGSTLSWWQLIPVFGFIFLRARCHFCTSRISSRYVIVELLTGFLFGLVAYMVSDLLMRVLLLVLMALFVVILVYDLLHTIIPDEYVLAVSGVALLMAGLNIWYGESWLEFSFRFIGAFVAFLFFATLWRISNGRWIGFGDAKFAVPLGFILSWPAIVSGIILSFWIGAVVSVCLLLLQRLIKRGQYRLWFLPTSLTIKSEIPFAPFLTLGFLLVYFFSLDVFVLMGSALDGLITTVLSSP